MNTNPADTASREPLLSPIGIVLVETSHPGNVGAVARAMKVMGFGRLALVAPRFADVLADPKAIAFASGAGDVLADATIHPTLDDALGTTTHAIALSARPREFAPPPVGLRDAAVDAVARASGEERVAFVFGSERYGLSNENVLRCQASCRVDTSSVYGSLNLAQAVQLATYECRMAMLAGRSATPVTSPVLATSIEREALIDHFEEGLLAIGYLDPDAPKKLMPRLRRLFARAGLEHEEVQWLRGMAKAMIRASAGTPR